MNTHEKLNYVEFAAKDLNGTKQFFESVFNWKFVDYGPDYTSFSDQGLDGGFYKADLCNLSEKGGALLVFYSANIEQTLTKIKVNNGRITRPIFSFPGGRRFHFEEPSGNEFAVWSEGQ
ncbi:VOC family protein [Aliiglaciecola sp. 3_MG-2023]|uniref:VOC family protein n=1 Tax=Aliiglaciecola sp. 3_MG-2023 TaxID=3062644 RepID=UPI0026E160AE|nr:VOC family protein [Aliiglaciecola sp. 3_MG-2023]MDO6692975.1 VOC family protein [Aliiglaciecola sp. 3_MG-2023]